MGHKHVDDAVLVQFRASREFVKALSARARVAGVTQAEFLRSMLEWELDAENPWPVERLLGLERAQVKALERRGRVRV